MTDIVSLDEGYSTTRLIFNDKCLMLNEDNSQFNIENSTSKKGGLRTKGYFKKSFDDKPLISIITVVFNGEKYLEDTIQSVINQTYGNVEYIIIDGGSTDATLDIIKKYEDKIDYWVSEKDRGIYDAMNKGIDVASGVWINFMNAGDSFYDEKVLKNIFYRKSFENIDVIYGDHNVIYPSKTRIAKAGMIKNIWKGSQFCHQASFISSKVHKENKFNLSNRIGADFEFFYKLYSLGRSFRYIDLIIANYSAGGLSDIKRVDSIVGWWNVVEKDTKVNLYYIWIILKEIFKGWVKKFVKY
ncbi:glycosyltransferase [Aliarcobacter cryaerophilus]|uniref:glycosyltransferase family 2 protein n=1 Tax=Aliarcobacter cryaerophilus TaxID=28198 RepID=UPI0021B6BCBD|nr:glycosyltransferase family 2 protein [Aliarcobacter cryaerophilus]MCT7539702.1 glycosyltransferase [Aliarcobacter cryaerophilus]